MKITLDHNVVIDLANRAPNVERLREAILAGTYEAFVIEIGASEMRQRGIRPDRYDLFEQLLRDAGIECLRRLTPLMIFDVTFWDHGIWADDGMIVRSKQIEEILFGNSQAIAIVGKADDSAEMAAWLNRICDVHSMWCHLHYANDIFVSSDGNFHKATKLPRLLAMGAGRIARPEEL